MKGERQHKEVTSYRRISPSFCTTTFTPYAARQTQTLNVKLAVKKRINYEL